MRTLTSTACLTLDRDGAFESGVRLVRYFDDDLGAPQSGAFGPE